MKDVHVREHARRRRKIERVVNEEGITGYEGLPPMGKRFTMRDAEPILREVGKLRGRGAFVDVFVVGSVATRGSSTKDLDMAISIDPSRVGVDVGDLDGFYEWLYESGDQEANELTEAFDNAMGDAGAYRLDTSERDPLVYVLVRGGHSVPVDLWVTWTNPEMERAGEEELRRVEKLLEQSPREDEKPWGIETMSPEERRKFGMRRA